MYSNKDLYGTKLVDSVSKSRYVPLFDDISCVYMRCVCLIIITSSVARMVNYCSNIYKHGVSKAVFVHHFLHIKEISQMYDEVSVIDMLTTFPINYHFLHNKVSVVGCI